MTSADRVQIELMRRATPGRRAELAGRLSADVKRLAERAIAEAFPELGEWDRKLKFVEIHYGRDLAARVARDLERRGLLARNG